MIRVNFASILVALLSIPAFYNTCQAGIVLSLFDDTPYQYPVADTVYVYDTVYRYQIVYDTVYYSDSVSASEKLSDKDSLLIQPDSSIFAKQRLAGSKNGNRKDSADIIVKTSYSSHLDFNTIDKNKDELPKSGRIEELEKGKTRNNSEKQSDNGQKSKRLMRLPFVFFLKDTLYRADTVVIFENLSDTVFYFKLASRADTSVYQQTIIENRENIVVVNKMVNIKIRKKNYVIVDDLGPSAFREYLFRDDLKYYPMTFDPTTETRNKSQTGGSRKNVQKNNFKTGRPRLSHLDLENSARIPADKAIMNYPVFIEGGVSLFVPEINFVSKNENSFHNVDLLNSNTTAKLSYGISAGLKYCLQNLEFESGVNFVRQNFEYLHQNTVFKIDSSWYWKYFENQKYHYDTTWYLNLDTLLSTGDTLLIPNVDSTMTWFTDSTSVLKYDTAKSLVPTKYNYSFSYLEIPIIVRYPLVKGNLFCNAAIGLIPSFLISKSGNILSDQNDYMIETEDIAFEYGFNLAFYGALAVGYKINDRCAILTEPFIKRTIISGMQNDRISVKTNSWGVRISISYRL